MVDFAILAPVPEKHLLSGIEVAARERYVAFGSMKWELFAEVDRLRHGEPVPMPLYVSHESDPAKLSFRVTWVGWYVAHVRSDHGAHPAGMKHRPPTSTDNPADNLGHWAVFWHVKDLRALPEERTLPISALESYSAKHWRKNHPPHGPEIVGRPESLTESLI